MKNCVSLILIVLFSFTNAQNKKLKTPPMGYMTWNFYGLDINEDNLKKTVDLLVSTGLKDAGYDYLFIDDGWQGGRDNKNNMIPDPKKFPSGMKALVDYAHSKGLKVGIYSDAATLTCGMLTASYGFEEQDAKTFADWGMDYLKYDYCNAPTDWQTAISRYEKMHKALEKSGRDIVFAICEWGDREPWHWASKAGGDLWRTTADVRDKWKSKQTPKVNTDLHGSGAGILDILNINAELSKYAQPGAYNDPDMLLAGLYGKTGPAKDLGGIGCTDTEYQSQMSLWCLMNAPLMISFDVANMNDATRKILMNKDIIALDQDPLGKAAERIINNKDWQVFVKPLANGDVAVGFLNVSDGSKSATFSDDQLGIVGKKSYKDLWTGKTYKASPSLKVSASSHETKVFRFSDF